MKGKNIKRVFRLLGILAGICGVCYVIYIAFLNPYRSVVKNLEYTLPLHQTLTKKEAKEELDYLIKHIRDYHPAYLDGSYHLEEDVEKQYKTEVENLADEMSINQLWQASARILAKLKDGHSGVKNYPEDVKYISSFHEADKYHILSIDDIPIADLYHTYLEQASYELEDYAKYKFKNNILREDYLQFVGIDTSDGVDFLFKTDMGEQAFHYEFVSLEEASGYDGETNDQNEEFVYYEIMKEKDVALLTLNKCNYNDTYKNVLKEFFQKVNENNIQNIAIDLRSNSGGNSRVVNEFLTFIDIDEYKFSSKVDIRFGPFLHTQKGESLKNKKRENAFTGKIYILTSAQTFSSAMQFATTISDNKIGTIVGEIPGNMPTHYGDVLQFQMPKSNLYFTITYKRFHRGDLCKDHEPLIPDYIVESKMALDKVFELISYSK